MQSHSFRLAYIVLLMFMHKVVKHADDNFLKWCIQNMREEVAKYRKSMHLQSVHTLFVANYYNCSALKAKI